MASERRLHNGRARREAGALVARSRGEGSQIVRVQRTRLLWAAERAIAQDGYAELSVERVCRGARVSRRTFYELFDDREDCFVALFQAASRHARKLVVEGYRGESGKWLEKVRGGVAAFVALLEQEPSLRRVLISEPLAAGEQMLYARAAVLEELARAIAAGAPEPTPDVVADATVGAALSVIQMRIAASAAGPLDGLVSEVTGVIVLPWLGAKAARRELERPAAKPKRRRAGEPAIEPPAAVEPIELFEGLPMRITYRTLRVLSAIADISASHLPSNREIADGAGVRDQGQISKLLARLEKLELIENAIAGQTGRGGGEANAWRLTELGAEVERAVRMPDSEEEEAPGSESERRGAHKPRKGRGRK